MVAAESETLTVEVALVAPLIACQLPPICSCHCREVAPETVAERVTDWLSGPLLGEAETALMVGTATLVYVTVLDVELPPMLDAISR